MQIVKDIGNKLYGLFNGIVSSLQASLTTPVGFFSAVLFIAIAVDFLLGGSLGYIALFVDSFGKLLSVATDEIVKGGLALVVIVYLLLNRN